LIALENPFRMRQGRLRLISVLAAAGVAGSADARLKVGSATALATDRILSPAVQPLTVTSPAADPDKPMNAVFTELGKDISPSVAWEGAPPQTRAYAVIMEDPDGHGSRPALHWLVYNIPGSQTSLPRNVRTEAQVKGKGGIMQGKNFAGGIGYIGPNPPAGDPPHHYHIEVFALSRPLRLKGGATLEQVLNAMNETVVAEGETVATFAAPAAKAADAETSDH
jgi:Raf kinase inhibitor-like YbhB/YbcL family protein